MAMGALYAWLGLARYHTLHNETFDLAMYARMAWGLVHGQWWDPLVGAHFFGLHLAPVLAPLGLLGTLLGTVPVLLVAQAMALAAAAWPLARIGARRFGPLGATAGAAAWLLHPNIGHVAGYEMHPGTLAVLPLAWAMDCIDRQDARGLAWATVGVLLCREDLGLITALMAGSVIASHRGKRAVPGAWVALGASLGVVCLFFFVLHPFFAPPEGSLEAHFGPWGDGLAHVLLTWITEPGRVVAHLLAPERLAYVGAVLGSFALLPLLAPRWLLFTLPVFAINLMSHFPAAIEIREHYLTPALPVLVAAALQGAHRLSQGVPAVARRALPATLLLTVAGAHQLVGGTPLSVRFDGAPFRVDGGTHAAARVLAAIPEAASVQAPPPLLPHLAEREVVQRAPPPERVTDYVVLDLWHRERYWGQETLLRTAQEPHARNWLARDDHAAIVWAPPYVLLERGSSPEEGVGRRYIVGRADPDAGVPLTTCLSVLAAEHLGGDRVALDLVARDPCWRDMALRVGVRPRPTRAELPFDGILSPEHLRRGHRVRSEHRIPGAARAQVVHVGAVRSSGCKPVHGDPYSVAVALDR